MNTSAKPKSTPWLIAGTILIAALVTVALTLLFIHTSSKPAEDEPSTSLTPGDAKPYHFDYSWTKHPYIAHAGGGILGDTYTNSYEAFLLNYRLGHRVFEIDLNLTSDGHIVATHDADAWRANAGLPPDAPFTLANFRSHLYAGKYHGLTCEQIARLMLSFPDTYLITDSKATTESEVLAEFNALVSCVKSVDAAVLDHFIVQIYNPTMLDWVMSVHPWKSVIYTLYNSPDWTPENVLAFAKSSGVEYITIWHGLITPEILRLWQSADMKVAAHTVNDFATAENLFSLGVSNIYTDYITP